MWLQKRSTAAENAGENRRFRPFLKEQCPIHAGSRSYVAQVHGLESSAALACVQELWHLNLIKTVVVAPGEWNGRYAITSKGFDYVITHAT